MSLLGAWVVQQEGKDGAAAMDEGEAAVGKDDVKDDSTVAVGEHERREAVDRWSSILQILSGTSCVARSSPLTCCIPFSSR